MDATQDKIFAHIRRAGRGKVFVSKDFLDLGTRAAIDQALSRLARSGDLVRLGRGLYSYPLLNTKLGIPVSPDLDEIAYALGRKTGSRIVPSGAVAANRLGLSTQVPAQPVYLSDGRAKRVRVGNIHLQIKHVSPKELPSGSKTSELVFQALRHLGKDAVDDGVIESLRKHLSPGQRHELRRDARYTTDWIADTVRRIAAPEPEGVVHG